MHQYLLSGDLRIIWCFLFILAAVANTDQLTDEISINCGSTGASVSMNGRRWLGDIYSNLTIQGSSTRATVTEEPTNSGDPVPYKTARISRSRFSYIFQVNSGQKLIRLHFNPSSYNGFRRSKDLFTVQAGRFILLSNFSASITADALAVNFLTKEFCIITEENYALNVTFSPATACSQSQDTHAFINGIEVISVPETISYCHTGDIGVQVLGEKFLVYIDNKTAFEMVHRHNVKRGSVSSSDDLGGMWPEVFSPRNKVNNFTWRISVDVGFMYLVRLHFCELGLKMADNSNNSFSVFINHMVAYTDAHFLRRRKDNCGLLYRNYIVMAKGPKLEGKRGITISLQPKHKFICGHGPLEGFEIFKLSNHDYNLGSPNLLPPEQDLPFWTCPDKFSVLGSRHAVATAVIIIVSLVNVIVHILRQTWEANFPEEKKPTTRVTRTCRYFSLTEIRTATKEFNDSFIIGMGGFGKVYKGFINDGPEIVAVKRLKPNSKQGKREFWTEVETLSELRHVNLVSLIGYCNEQKEMILVYDYMPNGTLADHLYRLARKNRKYSYLSWEERLTICIGAGRGLDYLHTGKGVIHRDVKATNILLDETFVAKVSDFGLAKTGCVSGLQNQDSTNLQGTFGYIDPDYFKTRKLTTKSDTYAFGVVLLEVLCGRPAVDPLAAEDEHSLTMWARDNISRGKVDQILAPSLRGGISPDSLKTFLEIVESCLHDDPNKRPPIVLVVIALEFALVQQNDKSLVPNNIASFANFLPFTNRSQQENASYLVPNEIGNAADVMQCLNRTQLENPIAALPNEITADVLPHIDRMSTQLTMPSSHVQSMASLMKEETSNRIVNSEPQHEKIDGRKTLKHKLSQLFRWVSAWKRAKPSQRAGFAGISISAPIIKNVNKMTSLIKEQTTGRLVHSEPPNGKNDGRKSVIHHKLSRRFPWNSVPKREKPSKRTDFAGISMSAPITKYVSNETSSTGSRAYQKMEVSTEVGIDDVISTPNFRIFSFSELKIATRNFKADLVIGEGGFGKVYKGGILEEKSTDKNGSVSTIAIKRLNRESWQGFDEWLSEINFLEKLSHPNLVKLLGYCLEDKELLLVYEFMQKGSLEHHLFPRSSATQTLPWNFRLKILIGAARGLAHLHTLKASVIYRDFKTSNILLDRSYNAKLSDFGLAKLGPFADHSHVTTRVMGTYGYCAPEYMATGHLYVKSDVYGFGVVLLEMLTGLRTIDRSRPSRQQNLVEWVKPLLVNQKRKVFRIMDPHLKGSYPRKSAFEACQLAKKCLDNEPRRRPSMKEVVETLENFDLVAVKC